MSKIQQEPQKTLNFQTIIENLENEAYLTPKFNITFKNEVKSKIEEFSHWFNSTARLYLLKCDPTESEMYVYLLLNLKKKLQFAISGINKSVSKRGQSYICNVCDEEIKVKPWQNVWNRLQDHPHFEESYSNAVDQTTNIVTESLQDDESSLNYSEDLSEESDQVSLSEPKGDEKFQEEGSNDLQFNSEVAYDEGVEKTLYPEALVRAAHKIDHVADYTVRRHAVDQGVCLLCPCSLVPRGKISNITPFVIKSHAYGHKHLKSASTTANTSALKKYHEFWRSQEAMYQAHQIYFIPEISVLDRCKCRLCQQSVSYDGVIGHIKTKKLHMARVLKIFYSPKEKLNEFSLFDMQVKMYDNSNKKDKKQKTSENKVSRTAKQKCVFVKFLIKPNQVNLLPRYNDHSKFLTRNADLVSCRICKISFCNSSTVIKRHILSDQHTHSSGIPRQKYTFFCDFCKIHLKNEDAWDDHFAKGSNNHANIPEGRRLKVAEYECTTCNFVIYGDQSSLNRHISSRRSKGDTTKEIQDDTNLQNKATHKDYNALSELLSQLLSRPSFFMKEETPLQSEAVQNKDLQHETLQESFSKISAPLTFMEEEQSGARPGL